MPMMSAKGVSNSPAPAAVTTTAAAPAAYAYDASGDSVMSSIQPLIDYITENQNYTNAYNSAEAAEQRRFQADQAALDRAFNADQAAINRNWQEMMSNSAHQREVRDLLAAGLNPVLSASGGNGASTGSGATASMQSTPNGSKATAGNVNSALVSLFGTLLDNQTKVMMSMSSGRNASNYYDAQLALAELKREWELQDRAYTEDWWTRQKQIERENQIAINNAKPGSGWIAGALQQIAREFGGIYSDNGSITSNAANAVVSIWNGIKSMFGSGNSGSSRSYEGNQYDQYKNVGRRSGSGRR